MRGAVVHSTARPVVIVLFDPAGDALLRFLQAAILRRPHFLRKVSSSRGEHYTTDRLHFIRAACLRVMS